MTTWYLGMDAAAWNNTTAEATEPHPKLGRVCRRRERPERRSADTIQGLVNSEAADVRYTAISAQ